MAGPRTKKQNKVTRIRRPLNIGSVFFIFIAGYLIVCIYMFLTSTHISGYEVLAGTLTAENQYTGVAIREEQVFYADNPGYVNYYAREGEKVSPANTVYTIDENGQMAELLQESAEGVNLTEEHYASLRNTISAYAAGRSDLSFSEVYDFKYTINGAVLDMINETMSEQLEGVISEAGGTFTRFTSGGTGIVEYYVDGMEDLTLDTLNSTWFDQENYERKNLRSEELVSVGDPVYKLVTEEKWQLVFPADADTERYLREKMESNIRVKDDGSTVQMTTYIEVRFKKDGESVWPSVALEYRDGQAYGILTFVNSMVRYADQRFLDFEILRNETAGLKIPVTTKTKKDFYVIPVQYLTKSGDEIGVMKQVFDENGNSSTVFTGLIVYYQDEELFYADPLEEDFATSERKLEVGNTLVAPDSSKYQVGEKKQLEGVYNINKGYTVFRRIEVLQENEEFCIVKEGTSYGLSVYDHIVLNADSVEESEVIY